MRKLKCGIYQIRNLLNNDIYIGQSRNFKARRGSHFSQLKNNKSPHIILQRAYNKYGKENFVFEILIYCEIKDLNYYEQSFVDLFDPAYNILKVSVLSCGGDIELQKKMNEARKEIRMTEKIRKAKELTIKKHPRMGLKRLNKLFEKIELFSEKEIKEYMYDLNFEDFFCLLCDEFIDSRNLKVRLCKDCRRALRDRNCMICGKDFQSESLRLYSCDDCYEKRMKEERHKKYLLRKNKRECLEENEN